MAGHLYGTESLLEPLMERNFEKEKNFIKN